MMGVCNNKEAQQLQMITEEYIYRQLHVPLKIYV